MIGSRDDSISSLIVKEGLYSNDPNDPGGPTKYGITQQTLRMWRGRPVSAENVEALTEEEAIKIYVALYWDRNKLSAVDLGLAHFVMDSVVQHGQVPIKWLQKLVSVDSDGIVGAVTITAVRRANPLFLLHKLAVKRSFYYESLETYSTFKNGWKDRLFSTVIESAIITGTVGTM